MVAPKKRITSELLHIALVITLLRGDARRYELNSNIISTNFFNDVHDLDHIEGPNWAYTRTNYHRLFIDPGADQIKSLSGDFNPFYDAPDIEDELDLEDSLYRHQSRLLMLSRLNSPYKIGKEAPPAFQDITAYLLSDTTSVILPNSLASLPEVQPPVPGSSGGGSGLSAPSPSSVDSGHEDSGDEGRISTSESEADIDIVASILSNQIDANSGDISGDEEVSIHDDDELIRSKLIPQLPEEPGSIRLEYDLNTDLNQNLDISDIDPSEFLFFLQNNNDNGSELLGATALPLDETPAFAPFSRDYGNSPSLVSDLFGLEEFTHESQPGDAWAEEMEWSLAEEEASLSFYKNFNDISETEMMNSVSPRRIQGGVDVKVEEVEDERTGSVSDVDDTEGAAGTSSSHSDPPSQDVKVKCEADEGFGNQDDDVTALIDELWETDSGIFDFLDSPSAQSHGRSFGFEDLVTEESSELSEVDVESIGNADDSISVDMIQAAPIHANARPTSHPAQPRGFQVHARMPGLLRGSTMDQRWQELASLLSLQQPPHDGSGGPLPPSLSHPFAPHHHHHHHHLHHGHAPPTLHHHSMHHPPFSSGGPPAAPYNSDSARSVLLQNATLPPPDLNSTTPYASVGMGPPPNLGSAVASSMHLTNSSDPMIDPSSHYKMIEPSHDMIYYPNASNTEMHNQTTEGFLSSILNDDDLQLMDMAMNEGMYTMRMLDNGGSSNAASLGGAAAIAHGPQPNLPHGPPGSCPSIGPGAVVSTTEDRMEASSDSAVSSMGSERIPPMTDPAVSDNEWVEPDSHPHSSHDSSPYSLDYSSGKLRGYDYYGKERVPAPVAQKKHHMFGKRYQQEHGSHPYGLPAHTSLHLPYPSSGALHSNSSLDSLDMKYSCSVDFARHQNDLRGPGGLGSGEPAHNNHTYSLPPSHPENPLLSVRPSRQPTKDKLKMNEELDRFAEESLSRDEKRARAMSLPITTEDVINLPMDEFNERLSKYDLTEAQLSLIRDIRRRGKNKVAAQNCRKRKLDQILQLADEVQRIRERKQNLLREQDELMARRNGLKDRYTHLYRHVFQALRDPDGHGYSPYDYSLQQAADGNIILVPRNASQPSTSGSSDSMNPSNSARRDKSKDEFKKGEGQS